MKHGVLPHPIHIYLLLGVPGGLGLRQRQQRDGSGVAVGDRSALVTTRALTDVTFDEVAAAQSADLDYVELNLPNGPFHGALHAFAWRPWGGWSGRSSCNFPTTLSNGNKRFKPCGALPSKYKDSRLLGFDTGFYSLNWDVDMMQPAAFTVAAIGTPETSTTATFRVQDSSGTWESCTTGPEDSASPSGVDGGYPVRMVRSGRYHSHFSFVGVKCGGTLAQVEIHAWPDCFSLNLTSTTSVQVEVSLGLGAFTDTSTGGISTTMGFCVEAGALSALPHESTAVPASTAPTPAPPTAATHGCPATLTVSRVIHWAWAGNSFWFCANPAELYSGCPFAGTTLTASEVPSGVSYVTTAPAINKASTHNAWCSGAAAGDDAFTVSIQSTATVTSNQWGPITFNMVTSKRASDMGLLSGVQVTAGADVGDAGCGTMLTVSKIIHWAWAGNSMYFCTSGLTSGCPLAGTTMTAAEVPSGVSIVTRAAPVVQAGHTGRCPSGDTAYSVSLESTDTATAGQTGPIYFVLTTAGSGLTVTGEGPGYRVDIPSGMNIQQNEAYRLTLQNPTSQNQPIRLHLFMSGNIPAITGIAALLRNTSDLAPSGMHVQISKNWHSGTVPVQYDGYWLSAYVVLRLPPFSQLTTQFMLVYQYFGALHSVSHAQLCLIGWGTNLQWEEVGVGSAGESITYEPVGHHRRTLALDTRPFLVCGKDSPAGQCSGSESTTGWTENHGGAGFLAAFDAGGSYQYLTGVKTHHSANGPKLTNATYTGLTVDGAIHATQRVSTWAATDFVRHLHAFRYEVRVAATYPRLVFYQLGSDKYNYVKHPGFAYGNGAGLVGEMAPGPTDLQETERYEHTWASCAGPPPCWFALTTMEESETNQVAHRGLVVRKWEARLGGSTYAAGEGFTFRLVGTRSGGTGLELGLPDGVSAVQPGDFVEAELELFLYPRSKDVYYGSSQRLKDLLDTSTAAGNNWTVAFNEAAAWSSSSISMEAGTLERTFPLRIQADSSGHAQFRAYFPSGWSGTLPVSIAGVQSSRGGTLWRWAGTQWVSVQGTAGDFQVNHEGVAGYVFTYSLVSTDFASAPTSELFAFSANTPATPVAATTTTITTTTATTTVTGTTTTGTTTVTTTVTGTTTTVTGTTTTVTGTTTTVTGTTTTITGTTTTVTGTTTTATTTVTTTVTGTTTTVTGTTTTITGTTTTVTGTTTTATTTVTSTTTTVTHTTTTVTHTTTTVTHTTTTITTTTTLTTTTVTLTTTTITGTTTTGTTTITTTTLTATTTTTTVTHTTTTVTHTTTTITATTTTKTTTSTTMTATTTTATTTTTTATSTTTLWGPKIIPYKNSLYFSLFIVGAVLAWACLIGVPIAP